MIFWATNAHEKVSYNARQFLSHPSSFVHRCHQPVGVAIHVKYMRPEGQAVNESRNHGRVLKQFRPAWERQVCRYNRTAFFATVGDHFEQQLGLVPVEAQVTKFVQDQQIGFGQGPFQFSQLVVVSCFTKLRRQRGNIFK